MRTNQYLGDLKAVARKHGEIDGAKLFKTGPRLSSSCRVHTPIVLVLCAKRKSELGSYPCDANQQHVVITSQTHRDMAHLCVGECPVQMEASLMRLLRTRIEPE